MYINQSIIFITLEPFDRKNSQKAKQCQFIFFFLIHLKRLLNLKGLFSTFTKIIVYQLTEFLQENTSWQTFIFIDFYDDRITLKISAYEI